MPEVKRKEVVPLPLIDQVGMLEIEPGYGFTTQYVMVYGTLRLGGSNYKRLELEKHTEHVGTFRLPGWQLSEISAWFTGELEDTIVVDLLKIADLSPGKSETLKLSEINYRLDILEGVYHGMYNAVIIPIVLEDDTIVYSKIYQQKRITKSLPCFTGDFLQRDEKIDYPSINLYTDEIHEDVS